MDWLSALRLENSQLPQHTWKSMPAVRFIATRFPPVLQAHLAGSSPLAISWAELVWGAITVGRAELAHVVRHGAYSYFEIAYRAAILFANLRELPDGNIARSEAYDGLDPSEKGAVSYFLGLTLTKVFSHRLLNVPWLMHLDVYREKLRPILRGRSRPDLVGMDIGGDWVVIESKGRTNTFDKKTLTRAKTQAEQIITIAGRSPTIRCGFQSYFSKKTLRFATQDPSETRRSKLRLPLDSQEFITDYYRPFRAWLARAKESQIISRADHEYRIAALDGLDLEVGLDVTRTSEDSTGAQSVVSRSAQIQQENPTSSVFVGADGVIVRAGGLWSIDNMQIEPQSRAV